jgi:hypothetical protein
MLFNGKLVFAYDSVEISEYLDTITGEIISAAKMSRHPDRRPTIRVGELALQKQAAISRLRPEVAEFAYFVLAFRDQRRGVTPTMEVLVKWFALMTGRRASDIRRYLPRLDEAGICQGSVMHPLFQFAGTKLKKSSHLGAEVSASGRFAIMRHRYELRKADEAKRAEFARRHHCEGAHRQHLVEEAVPTHIGKAKPARCTPNVASAIGAERQPRRSVHSHFHPSPAASYPLQGRGIRRAGSGGLPIPPRTMPERLDWRP